MSDTVRRDYPILVFGHGKISICTTQDADVDHINGIAFVLNDDFVPIGMSRDHQVDVPLDELNTVVQLRFDCVGSIDVLMLNLEQVKQAMLAAGE